ncbi:hypothetical protein RRG08_033911 [Elysia crispata]|uniref:Uncharacterized protein n=1 Tax=Elysia crispata TaxID=231223 RepID=A0AAE1B8W8_9GAST|nr:hypothetical protein RRG08_033911 [Elysia crispata]
MFFYLSRFLELSLTRNVLVAGQTEAARGCRRSLLYIVTLYTDDDWNKQIKDVGLLYNGSEYRTHNMCFTIYTLERVDFLIENNIDCVHLDKWDEVLFRHNIVDYDRILHSSRLAGAGLYDELK